MQDIIIMCSNGRRPSEKHLWDMAGQITLSPYSTFLEKNKIFWLC